MFDDAASAVSAQDIMELIDTIDEAIESDEKPPSMIFGKPVHPLDDLHPLPFLDVQSKNRIRVF